MEGCGLPLTLSKDHGGAAPQHQQWTDLGGAHHLPTAPNSLEPSSAEEPGVPSRQRAPFPECSPEGAAAGSGSESSCREARPGGDRCTAPLGPLQASMEPPCPRDPPLFPLQEDCGSDPGEEEGDVENLAGEIVYQPDGSAYIVESLGQLGQSEGLGGPGVLPPLLVNSLPSPGDVAGEATAATPQVINTFHIAASLGKWLEGSDPAFPSSSSLAGVSPILHSFRVFDLRHESHKDYLNKDGSAKSSCVSKDVPSRVDLSKFDNFVLFGKRKPILMCFLCRLSFGYVRSFVSHAVHDHRLTLSEGERRILSKKNISAILQGIGREKEPLVSFLEPKAKPFPPPLVSPAHLLSPGQSFYGKFSGIRVEGEEGARIGAASASEEPKSDLLAPEGLLDLGGLASSAPKAPVASVLLGPPAASPAVSSGGRDPVGAEGEIQGLVEQDGLSEKAESAGEEEEEEEEGCKGLIPCELEDGLAKGPRAGAGGGSSPEDLALSNQSISPSTPHVLWTALASRGTTSSGSPSVSSFVFGSADGRGRSSLKRDGRLGFGDESANGDGTPFPEPGEDGVCVPHHPLGGGLCELGGGGCPKCDTVLGSSRSLGGHVTVMHSRNSCKTLKCPQCNWHYKYQQTLEAHMKEKHPEPGGACSYCRSGQPHPRLARGETYTCGYKPFRCEVCNYSTTTKGNLSIHMQSDKHLNNMQNGGGEQGFSHAPGAAATPAPTPAATSSTGGGGGRAPSPTKPKNKPTWRCELCDYETTVARNLRIHMTSEKHIHHMMLLQQNVSQMQQNRPLGLGGLSAAEAELYQYYLAQNVALKTESPACEAQFARGSNFRGEPASPPSLGGEIPLDVLLGGGHLVSEELMSLGESLAQTNDPSLKLFQCAVCNTFTTDALDLLGLHLSRERGLPEEEWRAVAGESHQCKLCHYNTQLKANFHLHCQTEKHLQKLQLVAHVKEGGRANEWRLKCVALGNPVHLKCNACDYYTNSLEKLRLHTGNARHEASVKLYKHLQSHESGVEGDGCLYHCLLCNYSTKAKLNLIQHVRSMKHQRSEGLQKLQRLQKGFPEEEEEEDLGQIFTIQKCPAVDLEEPVGHAEGPRETALNPEDPAKEPESVGVRDQVKWAAQTRHAEKPADSLLSSKELCLSRTSESSVNQWPKASDEGKPEQTYQCPFCKYSKTDVNRLRVHAMTQHSLQPMLRCPLCQDMLSSKAHLQLHLGHLHSVSPDCVEKLILAVTTPEAMIPSSMFLPVAAPEQDGKEESHQQPESSEEVGKGLPLLPEITEGGGEAKPAAPRDDVQAGFFCWKKGCGLGFKSSAALQVHFSEAHAKRPQLPVSDRHVYKYRCNQCSLAFKTVEKLQLHSQYHVIRAATMCCLCQRSFRTFQALKKHLETSHLDLSEADLQQLYGGLLANGDLWAVGDPSLAEDHAILVEEEKEEEASDQEGKQSPSGSDSGSVQEDSSSEPKRALPFRKGPNFTMEKFLDPTRPYKCTVCKESFTQKNILLVHYNSVSHLHRLKRALQESSAGQPEPPRSPDQKPFKCSTCSVAYSQSSTLEIHMRSVLHQTKARAAKLEAAGGSSSSISLGCSTPSPGGLCTTSPPTASASSSSSAGSASAPGLPSQASRESPALSTGTSATSAGPPEPSEANRRKLADLVACRQQPPQPQPALPLGQVQLQRELQQQAALLQAQLFSPALLPHLPVSPEALQQQLLFPFCLPGAEFQLSSEVGLPVTLPGGGLLEDLKAQLPQPGLPQIHPQMLQPPCVLLQHSLPPDGKARPGKEDEAQGEPEGLEPRGGAAVSREPLLERGRTREKPGMGAGGGPEEALLLLPPPRIASDARGNATRALLENFGFELVIQYNENKQKAGRPEQAGSLEKLECEACGKFFSNLLILKSHQEHVHQRCFPFQQLERFAKQYREDYDKLYPLRPPTPEPPPPAPALPAAPAQQPSTPALPASSPSLASPALGLAPPALPLPQISMAMELSIFSPLLMQSVPLPALPAPLPPPLGPTDSLPVEMYQHQLNPGHPQQQQQQQQQNKRPRTRITDDQLRVLRQYFDINNSPGEEQIKEMADKSGLPQKVIKHWFRNTLFKERQRNKDSPYNFSNPPVTSLEELKVESRPPSPEPLKEFWGSKRSSRTRFTDYQLRVLQDFFDANAYPKDDEFEQLSGLLSLPTRVIVVWFQNARQKARKNYENQGEGKEGERRELTNDRYLRTSSLSYQCRKCSLVFQRIFDLIKHQKKLCYKDEEEEEQEDSQNEDSAEAAETPTPSSSSRSTPMLLQAYSASPSSGHPPCSSSTVELQVPLEAADSDAACRPKAEAPPEKPKPPELPRTQPTQTAEEPTQPKPDVQQQRDRGEGKAALVHPEVSTAPMQHLVQPPPQPSPPPSQTARLPLKALHTSAPQQLAGLPPQLIPYQCDQCKLAFPSFEHWQEHQQLHFLSAQDPFLHPQFLDRTLEVPFMLLDPSNPLLASQLLSGTLPISSAPSPPTSTSTMNTLKRKLEEKAGASPGGNESSLGGEEPQRDKRLRTTITPEQLEVLYQKYLLDSNPTRKMLDHIAHEVGLKKRVVQVWFQNTRARERKGQFRAVGPAQAHRRCPFCRALFKAKTALEAHVRSRHWHDAKQAGYSLTLSAMLLDCEGGLSAKGDLLDGASFSHLPAPSSSSDSQGVPLSPASKSLELSPPTLLSPSSIKVEGMEDFESPSISSVHLSFDQAKLDNDDCSSVNTAITDATTGDEGNADNDSAMGVATEARCTSGASESLTKAAVLAMSEYEDRLSSGLVSPAPSFYSKEYDNEGTVDYSETSSLADPCSPSPGTSGSTGRSGDGGERPGQKRFRTQMTNLQLKVLKSCFSDYRTPTMLECEVLGADIGLPKRVVQVWFQNARAKEKKSKLSMAKHFGLNQSSYEGPKTECALCGIKYGPRLSVRDHIFSQQHVSKVKEAVGSQLDKEKEYFDPATVRQLMAQQELDRLKKASEVLGLATQQQVVFEGSPLQALNLPTGYSAALQSIPPVLLPTLSSPSLPGFTPSNTALTSPKASLIGLPGTSVPSPGLPTSGLPNKPPSATLCSPTPGQVSAAAVSTPHLSPRKDKESEKGKGGALLGPKKDSVSAPALSMGFSAPLPAMELQALQAALNSDPSTLLTSQFLPCFVPGFSPYYAPQIPGALQGGYLQPLYGLESLVPYSPALSEALLGVSPASLLQQYQQYQQSLQEALQRQLPPPTAVVPKGSQSPVPAGAAAPEKEPAKEPPKPKEQRKGLPQEELAAGSSARDALCDPFIVPKVQDRLVCQKCQASFSSQQAARDHLKSLCYFGRGGSNLDEMGLHVFAGGSSSGSYQCTVGGEDALRQPPAPAAHQQQTVPRAAARDAKEPRSRLPHSARQPDPSAASTSPPAAHSQDSPAPPPATAPPAPRKPRPLGAAPGKAPPPLSSPPTVTSRSRSTSGVQPSLMPRNDCLEASDLDRSPKAGGPAEPNCPQDGGGLPSVEVDAFRL